VAATKVSRQQFYHVFSVTVVDDSQRYPSGTARRNDFREELFRHREKYIVSRIMFRRMYIAIVLLRYYSYLRTRKNDRLPAPRQLSSRQTFCRKRSLPFARAREDTWEMDQRRGRFNVAINNRYLLTERRRRGACHDVSQTSISEFISRLLPPEIGSE